MSVSTMSAETSLAERRHDIVTLLGRLLMSWIFLSSGFGKITNVPGFAEGLAKSGVPMPTFMGWLGAIVEFGGGLLILFGIKLRYAATLMILFVIVATLIRHRYWEFTGAELIGQKTNFWKNITIVGGFLFMYLAGAGRYSVDGFIKK